MIGQVFEPFFRANRARTKHIDGAGLGLTIANEIVQRAGGSITIENGPLRGLLQTVKLPAEEMQLSGLLRSLRDDREPFHDVKSIGSPPACGWAMK